MPELYATPEDERPDLQAALFYARERRRSFVGVSKLHRTHRFAGTPASGSMAVASISTGAAFPDRSGVVTFHTQVTATASEPQGLIFELGGDSAGVAMSMLGSRIAAVAGGSNPNRSVSIWDNVALIQAGTVYDLTLAIRPADAAMRLWVNGHLHTAYNPANSGTMGGEWASAEAGSFASGPSGSQPVELSTGNGAPSGFVASKPLSVYLGALPQEF